MIRLARSFAVLAAVLACLCAGSRPAAADDDCSEVRLDTPGGPMEHVHTLDQGMLNICGAYPPSELVDAWRFSHGPQPPPGGYDHATSPIVAAIGAAHARGEKGYWENGVNSYSILEYLRDNPSCSESDAFANPRPELGAKETTYITFMQDAWRDMTRYFNDTPRIRRIFDELEARNASPEETDYEVFYHQGAMPIANALTCKLRMQLNVPADLIPTRVFRNSNLAIANMLLYTDRVRYFYDYFQSVCSRYNVPVAPRLPPGVSKGFAPNEGDKATQLIKKRLGRHPAMPVIVNLCAGILEKPNYHGYTRGTDGKIQCQDSGTHSVLVIGKRRGPDGSCQLLVRNSWGPSCFHYRSRYPRPANAPPLPYDWHDPNCDEGKGQVWINEQDFQGNTWGVDYLDD